MSFARKIDQKEKALQELQDAGITRFHVRKI
jgi:hypothetical protein